MEIKVFKSLYETFLNKRKDLKSLEVEDLNYEQDLELLKSLGKKKVV